MVTMETSHNAQSITVTIELLLTNTKLCSWLFKTNTTINHI